MSKEQEKNFREEMTKEEFDEHLLWLDRITNLENYGQKCNSNSEGGSDEVYGI